MKRVVHGIETCDYCRDIIFILVYKGAFEGTSEGLRFNRLCALVDAVHPNTSHTTVLRHLRGLRNYVKRKKAGSQSVFYSLSSDSPLITKDTLDFQMALSEFYDAKYSNLTLATILDRLLALSKYNDLFTFKLELEAAMGKKTYGNIFLIGKLHQSFLSYHSHKLIEAVKGKTAIEYRNMIDSLNTEIKRSETDLISWGKRILESKV